MKTIYLIGGTMGVGKTTVCQHLKMKLPNSVFLDGDWCWDMHPFQVTEETKSMVQDNICHLLNNFITCSAYDHIIFCWVMHEQTIIDTLLSHLQTENCRVVTISLVCSKEALESRLRKDIANGVREEDILERSCNRIPLYETLSTIKIDVSEQSVEKITERIMQL